MTTKEYLSSLKDKNIDIVLSGDNLNINFDGELDEDTLEELKSRKEDIISFLKELELSFKVQLEIPILPEQNGYDLSSSQKRMWILSQFDDANLSNNEKGYYQLSGNLNAEALRKAFASIVNRHEILRTVFRQSESGDIKQYILSAEELGIEVEQIDLSQKENTTEEVREIVRKDVESPFDLAKGPLVRSKLIKTTNDKYVFGYTMHHIISDGWSLEVLMKEVFTLYNAYNQGVEFSLEPLRIQYKDFAAWQQAQLQGDDLSAHRSYWLEQFEGELPKLNLRGDKVRPQMKTYNGGKANRFLSSELSKEIKRLGQENGCTLFMTGLAAVKALLYRYTDQTDIIVGTGLAGRDHADLEDQIGFYLNTLAIRTKFDESSSFNDLLKEVKAVTLGAYEHQVFPFDELIENLSLEHDTSRSALFDVSVVLQNTGIAAGPNKKSDLGGVSIDGFDGGETLETSKFDLSFTYEDFDDNLVVTLVYNSDVYSETLANSILEHLENMFLAVTKDSSSNLTKLDYLSAEESHKLLVEFNPEGKSSETNLTVVELFEKQVEKTPENLALVAGDDELTYHQLNEQANQIANYLVKNHSIESDTIVGIKLEKRQQMIIAMLAVLKAGGGYMPIAQDYPSDRVEYMLEDSQCELLIDDEEWQKFKMMRSRYSKENLNTSINAQDLVYVIYTSGSNGKPKGVQIEHHSLVNLCDWYRSEFALTEKDKTSLYLGIAFDAAVSEVYPYLLSGACLIEVPNEIRADVVALNQFYMEKGITVSALTTQVAEQFIELENTSLRFLIVGGDKFTFLTRKSYQLANQYGPTENAVVTTNYILPEKQKLPVPIGAPISNVDAYVLDANFRLLPIGLAGELCIGGAGLSRGYLNNDELNQEKFIEHPFKPNERLYRTGDLCRWNNNGELVFVERLDDQVKVRGYRIELGEIETALNAHEFIDSSVVLVNANESEGKSLSAYIVGDDQISTGELRAYLKGKIPEFMIPEHYFQISEIPLTVHGKIDKKALLKPFRNMASGVEYIAPRNEIDEKLVAIWEEVLKQTEIGINDDFFELGGNSLKATRVISRVNAEYSVELDLSGLFEDPTINALSALIENETWLDGDSPDNEEFEEIKI